MYHGSYPKAIKPHLLATRTLGNPGAPLELRLGEAGACFLRRLLKCDCCIEYESDSRTRNVVRTSTYSSTYYLGTRHYEALRFSQPPSARSCLSSAISMDGRPWMNSSLTPQERAAALISQMTFDEQVTLLHGTGWRAGLYVGMNAPVDRVVGIPALLVNDGPQAVASCWRCCCRGGGGSARGGCMVN